MNEDEKCKVNKCSYDDVRNGECDCWNREQDYRESPEGYREPEGSPKLTDEDIPF
tara:strand:+ start:385 stop:549 length:165 start_codon:yes stop_codon:yes gene_type:complete